MRLVASLWLKQLSIQLQSPTWTGTPSFSHMKASHITSPGTPTHEESLLINQGVFRVSQKKSRISRNFPCQHLCFLGPLTENRILAAHTPLHKSRNGGVFVIARGGGGGGGKHSSHVMWSGISAIIVKSITVCGPGMLYVIHVVVDEQCSWKLICISVEKEEEGGTSDWCTWN